MSINFIIVIFHNVYIYQESYCFLEYIEFCQLYNSINLQRSCLQNIERSLHFNTKTQFFKKWEKYSVKSKLSFIFQNKWTKDLNRHFLKGAYRNDKHTKVLNIISH